MLARALLVAALPTLVQCVDPLRANWLLGNNFGVPGVNASYDYVVVGGGTAGLTMATRLAQQGTYSVAVVEAGGFYEVENGNLSQVPATGYRSVSPTLYGVNPLIDWLFFTTPQTGAADRAYHYARGKCFGGSSARNYLDYQRGTVGSFALWAETVGDDSYTFPNVLPFYKKSVSFTPPTSVPRPANISVGFDAGAYDASGGPLHVSYANYLSAFSTYAKATFTEFGLPFLAQGFASGKLIGHNYEPTVIDPADETRSTSETSFLTLALQTTSLIAYTKTLATRIIFDDSKKATGVTVQTQGVPYTLTANKEVILSAGAFQSPQLLMVSGIGPSDVLSANGIPVVADRPGVGQNMWDNVFFGPSYEVNLETSAIDSNAKYSTAVVQQYLQDKAGPLTNNGADYNAYDKVSNKPWATSLSNATRAELQKTFPSDWPEVEYLASIAYLGAGYGPPDAKNYAGLYIGLTAPLSRGTVSINSSSMTDPPIIDPAWLTSTADQEVMVAAFKRARQYFTNSSLSQITIGQEAYPGPSVKTDAQILEAIQESVSTLYHASCTCAMGKTSDPNAVIDSKANVIGVTGLRVVDISSFPQLPPGQPMATVYMLAEKIANDILNGN